MRNLTTSFWHLALACFSVLISLIITNLSFADGAGRAYEKQIQRDVVLGLQDPTKPLVNKKKIKSTRPIALQGIFMRNANFFAVVNGKQVKKGDTLGEALITGISKTTLTISRNGRKQYISLRPSIKRHSK